MTKSFDVFLSHNSKDKPAVRELAEALSARGLKVWLDEWELSPGQLWQKALGRIIETTRASIVLVGKDGLGPWQDREMRGCLSEFVDRKLPVIPVLLPDAPEIPRLPIFLTNFTWVDLREGFTEEGIDLLESGITGKRPEKKNKLALVSERIDLPLRASGEPPREFDRLVRSITDEVLREREKPAPISKKLDLPPHAPGEPPRDKHQALPFTASEKRREVFISYAWGDETPEGKIRAKVVEALSSALTENGFLPIRDRDQIRPGELISAFIRRLTRSDLVVAIISDKYLRSPYCMYEIHKLWQKSQEDADLLAERLVPIVLPEVKVDRLRDRAPYVRYWREQKEEMDELFRELGLHLGPGSLRELRLVRDFAQDVDSILVFLQDVLMPRKLEVHLDDGFQAVLDALRRRMVVGG